METRPDGSMTAVCGVSRSGKSAWTKQQLEKHKRIGVFDIKGEYGPGAGYTVVESMVEYVDLLERTPGPLKVAYRPVNAKQDFGLWSRAMLAWGKMAPCAAVAEETADVTSAGKAPEGWGSLCRMGMGFGIHIYALTQRPAESDKTALRNATMIHCCALNSVKDMKAVADEMGVEYTDIQKLRLPFDENGKAQPGPHYLQKSNRSKTVKPGKLTFK